MQAFIIRIDRLLAAVVGKLPRTLHVPFVWLGRFTSPLFWVTYLIALHIVLFSPGVVTVDAAAVMLLIPLASVIKLFFRRTRPPTVYADAMRIKSYSFPSSHAYSAMLSAGSLLAMSAAIGLWWGIAALILALVIGISRVFVGAHYPSDVVAGWGLGLCVASILAYLV